MGSFKNCLSMKRKHGVNCQIHGKQSAGSCHICTCGMRDLSLLGRPKFSGVVWGRTRRRQRRCRVWTFFEIHLLNESTTRERKTTIITKRCDMEKHVKHRVDSFPERQNTILRDETVWPETMSIPLPLIHTPKITAELLWITPIHQLPFISLTYQSIGSSLSGH